MYVTDIKSVPRQPIPATSYKNFCVATYRRVHPPMEEIGWHSYVIQQDMKILITNDDGIYSPGIMALARIASDFGEVRVFAPDVEQSSMGHAITHSRPLTIKPSPITFEDMEAYRVNGTPADCVALGTHMWEAY